MLDAAFSSRGAIDISVPCGIRGFACEQTHIVDVHLITPVEMPELERIVQEPFGGHGPVKEPAVAPVGRNSTPRTHRGAALIVVAVADGAHLVEASTHWAEFKGLHVPNGQVDGRAGCVHGPGGRVTAPEPCRI